MSGKTVTLNFSQSDFSVDPNTGTGYISQRKAAELCGVPRTNLRRWIDMNRPTLNLNENSQLDEKSFVKAVIMARQKNSQKAEILNDALLLAGARAFIYTQAGYDPNQPVNHDNYAKLHEPCVPVRWLAQQLNRTRGSVDRTLNQSLVRMRDFGLHDEVRFINGERCVSPAVILCSMFTGKTMQAMRAWLLQITEMDKLPDANTLVRLTPPRV